MRFDGSCVKAATDELEIAVVSLLIFEDCILDKLPSLSFFGLMVYSYFFYSDFFQFDDVIFCPLLLKMCFCHVWILSPNISKNNPKFGPKSLFLGENQTYFG